MLRAIKIITWGSWENVPDREKHEVYREEEARAITIEKLEEEKEQIMKTLKENKIYHGEGFTIC